jgi:hypothetical protein
MRAPRAEAASEFHQRFDHPPVDGLGHRAEQPPLSRSFRAGQVFGDENRQTGIDFHGGAQFVCEHALYHNIANCPRRFLVFRWQLAVWNCARDVAVFQQLDRNLRPILANA